MKNYFKPLVLALSLSGLLTGVAYAGKVSFLLQNNIFGAGNSLQMKYKIETDREKKVTDWKPVYPRGSVLVEIEAGNYLIIQAVKNGKVEYRQKLQIFNRKDVNCRARFGRDEYGDHVIDRNQPICQQN